MAPSHPEDYQSDTLSTSGGGIFPFMSLPAEIRIMVYKIVSSPCVCVPYRPHRPYSSAEDFTFPYIDLGFCNSVDKTDPFPFPPQVKALLQVKQIREDMLPHLHLAWVGSLRPGIDPYWGTFQDSIIPAVSHLTIGVEHLFDSKSGRVCKHPARLLRWMRYRSQYAPVSGRNLTHLTLIDGCYNWPKNPFRIHDLSNDFERQSLKEVLEDTVKAEESVKSFPMINGLRELKLVLMEHPGQVFLDRLSQKCETHAIDLQYIVERPTPTLINLRGFLLGQAQFMMYSDYSA